MKNTLIIIFLFITLSLSATTYYVSPTGSDAAAGTLTAPWATWHYAFSKLNAGDILYVRGGTYFPVGTVSGGPTVGARISYKNGTSSSPILISAYGSEVPVMDCSKITQAGWKVGLYVDGCSYITFKGLTVSSMSERGETKYPADGWIGGGSKNITMEQCSVTRCGSGFMWGSGNDYIYFTNCDSYNNADVLFGAGTSGGPGGYCDGFGNHQVTPGAHIIYYGCRAWNNSDDGWDGMDSNGYITYTNCWAIDNGKTLGDWTTVSGDGDGIKIGITPGAKESGQQRILKNCLAVGNKLGGFDESQDNAANADEGLYNCTAYGNGRSGFGFYQTNGSGIATLKNCVAYKNDIAGGYSQNVNLRSSSIVTNNSWQVASAADNDFLSLVSTAAKGPRKADGSLPDISFMHLASGSDLIDAGVNVGLSYSGNAPDLGAFESGGSATPPPPAPVAAAPVYTSSAVANTTPSLLEMTYNTTLANTAPSTSSFAVMVNSVARSVSTVAISGAKVQLTLSSAIKYGDIITVGYTKPSANPLQTTSGGLAVNISGQLVVNNLVAPTKDVTPVTATMTISPNHVHRTANITITYSSSLSTQAASITPEIIRISNLSGRLYIEKYITTGTTSVKIPINLRRGVYKVVLSGGSSVLATQNMKVY